MFYVVALLSLLKKLFPALRTGSFVTTDMGKTASRVQAISVVVPYPTVLTMHGMQASFIYSPRKRPTSSSKQGAMLSLSLAV